MKLSLVITSLFITVINLTSSNRQSLQSQTSSISSANDSGTSNASTTYSTSNTSDLTVSIQLQAKSASLYNYLKCNLCESIEMTGKVADCTCDFDVVRVAVTNFYLPYLTNLTTRYFRVDFDRKCPFWDEDGQCAFEACSVGVCDTNEVPKPWISSESQILTNVSDESFNVGWVSTDEHGDECTQLGTNAIDNTTVSADLNDSSYSHRIESDSHHNPDNLKFLEDYRKQSREIDWADMIEHDDTNTGIYVNLLKNRERYTGYSGPSAKRVWQAIMKENCFSESSQDQCLEKRVFYRLMSGLRASISTHIAMEYYFSDLQQWGVNIPLYVQAVGMYPDRIDNLYFTFLFVLRAVTKASDVLSRYDYNTGNTTEDLITRELMIEFLATKLPNDLALRDDGSTISFTGHSDRRSLSNVILEECKHGFDESALFQAQTRSTSSARNYWDIDETLLPHREEQALYRVFRDKFRNITRIMDCVTCEKCRLWGKLQILGLGTAIKILLSSEHQPGYYESNGSKLVLTRQEVTSLVNVLHQLSKSVVFAAKAGELELNNKLITVGNTAVAVVVPVLTLLFATILYYRYYR